jgi:6-methylsalicylate decarboxylase
VTSPAVGRIDVHHHLVPPAFVEAMARHGVREVASTPLPKWNAQASLDVMDVNRIATAILSLSAPGVRFGSLSEACDLARNCNEFAADLRAKHGARFGSFAVLPMPDAEASCREAEYALDTLRADGVVLLGSTDGVFLGDRRLDALMAELDRRAATVFVHPSVHASSAALGLEAPEFIVEFLCDTTRAAVNLILTGTMERYPRIRWILAHSGGFLPFVAWRVSLANMMPPFHERAPAGVLDYVRRFYFDTALSPSPMSLAALQQLVDPSHILFGSDFPFAPAPLIAAQTSTLSSSPVLTDALRAGVDRSHALALFPQFARPDETPTRPAPFTGDSLAVKARRVAMRPVVALLDRVRRG